MNNKAWVGALIAALSAGMTKAAGIDFNHVDPNTIRDLILGMMAAAGAGFTGVYIVPNRDAKRPVQQ